jgi:hypothetical protein
MAHYAFLDNNNIVTEVIVGRNEDEVVDGISDWEAHYGEFRGQPCKRTSYNGNIRFNYAGIGYTYDAVRDAFIPPKHFASWIIDEDTCQWKAPVDMPSGEEDYVWSELQVNWIVRPEKPDASTAWMWDYGTDQWIEFS